MRPFARWLSSFALLQMVACSGSVVPGPDGGSGGSTSASTSGTSGNTTSDATGSASSSTGGATVECELGGGAPAGALCAHEGELCDFAGSACHVTCTDGVWVEGCTQCPAELPVNGADCNDYYGVGPCIYKIKCGEASATCDGPTGLWVVTGPTCG